VSDGYKPYIHPVSKRVEWIRSATYEQLREGLTWALEAESESHEDYDAFADALGEMLAERAVFHVKEQQ
jgi:hypothetical protein